MPKHISRDKEALRQKQHELRVLLNEWDPIGVYGPDSDCPLDEYDCLFGILGILREGSSSTQLGTFISQRLKDHFGLDPDLAGAGEFAEKVHSWYWQDPLPGDISTIGQRQ